MLESDKIELERLQQEINKDFLSIMKSHQQELEILERRIADLETLLAFRVTGGIN